MPPRQPNSTNSDHDLLIRIDTKVENLNNSLLQLQNNFGSRVDRLEKDAVTRPDLESYKTLMERQMVKSAEETAGHLKQHDKDIAFTLRMIYIAVGALGALEVILRFIH